MVRLYAGAARFCVKKKGAEDLQTSAAELMLHLCVKRAPSSASVTGINILALKDFICSVIDYVLYASFMFTIHVYHLTEVEV